MDKINAYKILDGRPEEISREICLGVNERMILKLILWK
jgi:hypothetical protein